jgi:hypothetical protein
MLVGNKSDLESQRKIPKEMGELFAEEEGLLFGEASAKSGEGVEGLFMEIGTFSLFSSPFLFDLLFLFIPSHLFLPSIFVLVLDLVDET